MTSIRLLTMALPRLGLTPDRDTDWRVDASCASYDLTEHDPWHPAEGTQSADPAVREAAYDEARTICLSCPVRDHCLAKALEHGGELGMRGGLTPDEQRAAIRRARRLGKPNRKRASISAEPIKHGTAWGYDQHIRRHTPMCQPCREANSVARAERKKRKAAREAS